MTRAKPAPAILTAAELASLVGVTPQAVTQWARDAGLPRVAKGQYPAVECLAWAARHFAARVSDAPAEARSRRAVADAKRAEAEAQIAEERLAQIRAESVPLADAEEAVAAAASEVVKRLRALPAGVAKLLEGRTAPDISRILKGKLADALSGVADLSLRQRMRSGGDGEE